MIGQNYKKDEDGFYLSLNGKKQKKGHAHSMCVNSLAFSNDSSKLASGSADATIKLWDM
jgi:WD40 repeat protein